MVYHFTGCHFIFFLFSLFPFHARLKPLDVQFMKAIHNKVNVVPVIAKADTLTLRERERLKRRVRMTVTIVSGSLSIPDVNSSYSVMWSLLQLQLQCTCSKLDVMMKWLFVWLWWLDSFCNFDIVKILDEIDEHGIKIYHLPDAESDEDEDFKEQTRILKVTSPFSYQAFIPKWR